MANKNEMTKRQLALTVLRILKHKSAWINDEEPQIVNLEWEENDGEEKVNVRFWLNERYLADFFEIAKVVGRTSILYAHYKSKTYKELTEKESRGWRDYLYVGLI